MTDHSTRTFWALEGPTIRIFFIAAAALIFASSNHAAQAEVVSSGPSAFLLRYEASVGASPAQAYRALGDLPHWWNSAHTYSGDARRMSLDLRAGGCFCERWQGNSVEHGRVIMVLATEGVRTVRLEGALGPLQDIGASGILTFTLTPEGDRTKIVMTYRVAGEPGLGLADLAAPVESVLAEQFTRFIRYTAN